MGNAYTTKIAKESSVPTPPSPPIKKWLIFTIVSMALLMITIDSTIVATALHAIKKDLHTSVSWVGWTLTAYSLGFVLMLPFSAKLSIRFGHRRIFLASVATFTIASLLCGLSNNIYVLIVMRIIQAIGGAGLTPSATGIIVDNFEQSRDRFLGLFGSIFSVGAMIGPIFGGLFVTYWSWRGIFFINLFFGLLVILTALRHIPKSSPVESVREKMDLPGLLLLATGILSAMLAATYLGEKGTSVLSFYFIGLMILSILTFYAFFHHVKNVKSPFINPKFIFGSGFRAVNLVNIIHSGMAIGAISLVPFYAVNRYGISELDSGTLLVANGIASVILSTIMSIYLRRTGYRMPIYIGVLILATGVVLLAVTPLFDITPYMWLMMSTFLVGFGFGFMSPAGRNAGIQLAPAQSATIAAIRSMGVQFGQIISISIATAIIAGSEEPNFAQAMVYVGVATLLIISLSIVPQVPEHKGAW